MESKKHASPFHPVCVGALYTGIERGLAASILATRALGGAALPICTTHMVAGFGKVTDVLDVPTDNVAAQFEHLFKYHQPDSAYLGVLTNAATIDMVFRHLERGLKGPVVLNVTFSGPSGEDLAGHGAREALQRHLAVPEMVTISRVDAELFTEMQIDTLDDAQVAVQRLQRMGARRVLLRCGALRNRSFEDNGSIEAFWNDLYYDGEEFALFEAPLLDTNGVHGAGEAFGLALVKKLASGESPVAAIQFAKSYVTEALNRRSEDFASPDYFWLEQN